jgi:MFS superfamily sulfate permease-like transporter
VIARFFPIIIDLLTYNQATLFSDLIARLSIAVIVIPQGLAYAMIAGLPPIYGLYAALIPQLIHGILGTFVYGKAQKTTSALASNWMARIKILTKCRYFCIFACIYN